MTQLSVVCYGLCIHCIPAVFDTKPSPSSVVCGQFACLVSFLSTEANGFPFTQCDSFNINNIFIVFTIYTQSEIDFCFPFRMSSLIVTTSLPTVCAFICILIYPRIYTWENLFFFFGKAKKKILWNCLARKITIMSFILRLHTYIGTETIWQERSKKNEVGNTN